jgi:CRISPR-associated protein Cas5d
MTTIVRVRVSGEFACFSRPECKVERLSYEVMTPSAARGVLDAISWKPEMRWHVRRIEVLKPIRFIGLKRNEVQTKVALKGKEGVLAWMKDPASYRPQPAGAGSDDATPRSTVALRDVAYIIEAEPIVFNGAGDNTPAKYVAMLNRRVEKGQCHFQPALGCREFAARFEPPSPQDSPISDTRDLGLMLYDIIFRQPQGENRPVFFRARLENGVLDTRADTAVEEAETRREVLACSYNR